MKKKILVALLSLILTASMVCGCGNKTDPSIATDANPTTVDSTESTEGNDPTDESESSAETEESKNSEDESAAAPTQEPTQAPDAAPDAQGSSEGAETSRESESEGAAAAAAPAETTTPVAVNPDVTVPAEQAAAYTVTEMAATMYVKNAVNLRQGPGTEYAKVGNLTKGQQVTVTGQADNGWYQLDSGAFVSNNYLTDTAPAQPTTATATNVSTDQTGTIIDVGTNTESFGGTSVDFINYLNQQRTAVGLNALVWDDNLAAVAQRRAQELTVDNSHNGCPADCSEIIYMGGSSYTDWYNAWYNSQAHRENMFRDDHGTAACAYYYQNYKYYVVTLFKQREKTQEELDAIRDSMVKVSESENGVSVYVPADQVDFYETLDPNDPNDAELIKKMEELDKMADEGLIDVPSLD